MLENSLEAISDDIQPKIVKIHHNHQQAANNENRAFIFSVQFADGRNLEIPGFIFPSYHGTDDEKYILSIRGFEFIMEPGDNFIFELIRNSILSILSRSTHINTVDLNQLTDRFLYEAITLLEPTELTELNKKLKQSLEKLPQPQTTSIIDSSPPFFTFLQFLDKLAYAIEKKDILSLTFNGQRDFINKFVHFFLDQASTEAYIVFISENINGLPYNYEEKYDLRKYLKELRNNISLIDKNNPLPPIRNFFFYDLLLLEDEKFSKLGKWDPTKNKFIINHNLSPYVAACYNILGTKKDEFEWDNDTVKNFIADTFYDKFKNLVKPGTIEKNIERHCIIRTKPDKFHNIDFKGKSDKFDSDLCIDLTKILMERYDRIRSK